MQQDETALGLDMDMLGTKQSGRRRLLEKDEVESGDHVAAVAAMAERNRGRAEMRDTIYQLFGIRLSPDRHVTEQLHELSGNARKPSSSLLETEEEAGNCEGFVSRVDVAKLKFENAADFGILAPAV